MRKWGTVARDAGACLARKCSGRSFEEGRGRADRRLDSNPSPKNVSADDFEGALYVDGRK